MQCRDKWKQVKVIKTHHAFYQGHKHQNSFTVKVVQEFLEIRHSLDVLIYLQRNVYTYTEKLS